VLIAAGELTMGADKNFEDAWDDETLQRLSKYQQAVLPWQV
jgi:hypothetical protein